MAFLQLKMNIHKVHLYVLLKTRVKDCSFKYKKLVAFRPKVTNLKLLFCTGLQFSCIFYASHRPKPHWNLTESTSYYTFVQARTNPFQLLIFCSQLRDSLGGSSCIVMKRELIELMSIYPFLMSRRNSSRLNSTLYFTVLFLFASAGMCS